MKRIILYVTILFTSALIILTPKAFAFETIPTDISLADISTISTVTNVGGNFINVNNTIYWNTNVAIVRFSAQIPTLDFERYTFYLTNDYDSDSISIWNFALGYLQYEDYEGMYYFYNESLTELVGSFINYTHLDTLQAFTVTKQQMEEDYVFTEFSILVKYQTETNNEIRFMTQNWLKNVRITSQTITDLQKRVQDVTVQQAFNEGYYQGKDEGYYNAQLQYAYYDTVTQTYLSAVDYADIVYQDTRYQFGYFKNDIWYNATLAEQDGYIRGLDEVQAVDTFAWLKNLIGGVGDIFAIEMLPNLTIGMIALIPIALGLFAWIIKKGNTD